MRKTEPKGASLPPPPPVDSTVYGVESEWTGVVVRHEPGTDEERPHPVVAVVRWDRNGSETRERPGRVRAYVPAFSLREALSLRDQSQAVGHLMNLVRGEACAFWQSRSSRPDKETCREYRTWVQGRPCSGCFHCEAVVFLKRIDPSFDPYRP